MYVLSDKRGLICLKVDKRTISLKSWWLWGYFYAQRHIRKFTAYAVGTPRAASRGRESSLLDFHTWLFEI